MLDSSANQSATPTFTVISAVYNVARYLPDFIRSIDSQTFDSSQLQIVLVDDGSTDESLRIAEDWSRRRPDLVEVLTKENGGQGSARNLGLTVARGEWVTFIDPDDWVDDRYFETFADFSRENPGVTMMCANRIFFLETEGRYDDSHPLKLMFLSDKLVSIREQPDYFHGSAPAAFVRMEIVERVGLEFDVRVRPNFEDGHFCARYLLLESDPTIGFLRSATYVYRKRSDQSSTSQTSEMQPGRFLDVPRFGYLDVLDAAIERFGAAPHWLQNFILYELSWYFSAEERPFTSATAATGDVGTEFVLLLKQITDRLDPGVISSFTVRKYKAVWRDILLHTIDSESRWHTDYAVVWRYDESSNEVRVAYQFCGPEPRVRYLINGRPVEPTATKVRSHRYFGSDLMLERIAWIPLAGPIEVEIDGSAVELRTWWVDATVTSMVPSQVQQRLRKRRPRSFVGLRKAITEARTRLTTPFQALRHLGTELADGLATPSVRRLARTKPVRARYGEAWVLVDRLHLGNDSAEVLFHHLRENRPDINAWFVIEKGTDDWNRLRRSGCGHVVGIGSLRWKLLMMNCVELISSHADVAVMQPPAIAKLRNDDWRFTFLQHGVIKDDLSNWLNPKHIDTFVSSTNAEHQALVGDHTPYVFTTKEVKLTGLPRFDALHRFALDHPEPDTVIIAPTWRHWLFEPLKPGSQRRPPVSSFTSSEFFLKWTELLHSEDLKDLTTAAGLRTVFLPHPNLEPALPLFDIPAYIEVGAYADAHLHELYGRAFTLITDFSSAAFNAAYLGRQPIYYFFDHDLVMAGGHLGRRGYFDYRRDAFGPIVDDAKAVTDALSELIVHDGAPCEPYGARIASAFPTRDGRCSARVTAAIEARATGRKVDFNAQPRTTELTIGRERIDRADD